MMKSTMSASFTLTVVGFNSIATPARRTTTSRCAILATCCLHSCQQSGSNSGSNPPCIDQELPCCCLLGFSAFFRRLRVGCKFIEAPALQTTTSRRAILAASCLRSFEQPESNSGSNPTSIDREPPCCCPSSRPPSSSSWSVKSIEARARRTTTSRRAILVASCLH